MDECNLDQISMDDIMRRWPETIRVALRHHLLCVGCPVAPFHTLEDAIREHGLDGALLRSEFYAAITSRGRDLRPAASNDEAQPR